MKLLPFETSPYYEGFESMSFEDQMNLVRWYRNVALQASDWSQLADAPCDKPAWALYRQQLREFPPTWDGSIPVPFPVPPEG